MSFVKLSTGEYSYVEYGNIHLFIRDKNDLFFVEHYLYGNTKKEIFNNKKSVAKYT